MENEIVYRLAFAKDWKEAEKTGVYKGTEFDEHSGFVHLSTASQCKKTDEIYFNGKDDLVLIKIDAKKLVDLKWEEVAPRAGDGLFPHLYGPLPFSAVISVTPLPLNENGNHIFPGEEFGSQ